MGGTWAGFIRVSHMGDRQAGAQDFHADRDQTAAIKAAVPAGDKLVMLPAELDVSGGLPLEKRPSLIEAIRGVERGDYCGVIVAYLSRLGRNTREQLRAWDRVEQAGGRIICAAENIDTATASGRFMRTVLLANAEREREEHVDRFDNLRRWATEAGIWQGRIAPKGYIKGTDRKLQPGPDADLVRAAFRARALGASVHEIAGLLDMGPSGARSLLQSRVYLGELRVGQYVNRAAHPPIIDRDTWLRAQRAKGTRPVRGREPALLTGLARCQGCGHALTRTGTVEASVYSCSRVHSTGRCPAPAGAMAHRLDALVDKIARAHLLRLDGSVTHDDRSVERARAALASAEAELAHYLETISVAGLPVEAAAAGARTRQNAVEAAQGVLVDELSASSAQAVTADAIGVWDQLSVPQRSHALRGLIEVVIVKRAGGRGGGRGARLPLSERVRVIAYGTGLLTVPGKGLPFPDLETEGVLRM